MGTAGEGEHVTAMVKSALELGYRHIDTVGHHRIQSLNSEQSVPTKGCKLW